MKPIHAIAVACCAGLLVGMLPQMASAYTLDGRKWSGDKQFRVNSNSFNTSAKRDAVTDPAHRINTVGDQTFDFIEPWLLDTSSGMGNGQNEVYGSGSVGGDAATICWTAPNPSRFLECDIVVDANLNWTFGSPDDVGEDFWSAENVSSTTSEIYLRPVMMHELLHAVGLDHEDDAYSFMNYGHMPWANRDDLDEMIEPLPDDRDALRALYPTTGIEFDVAVLNTWIDYDDVVTGIAGGDAALQKILCSPSAGTAFSSPSTQLFQPWHCGNDFSFDAMEVCPGDDIYTRYTVANYSTWGMLVLQELWFSTNANLDTSNDHQSPDTYFSSTIPAGESSRMGKIYEVPSTVSYDTTYYPIIKAYQTTYSEEANRNNWIPLVGQIYVKPFMECLQKIPPG